VHNDNWIENLPVANIRPSRVNLDSPAVTPGA
jgi:hypothetical protein